MDSFSHEAKLCTMSAFAAALRRNEQGKTKRKQLSDETVKSTIYNVCSIFRTNLRTSPIIEADGSTSLMIKRQWDGYINDDPAKRTQKCLPINIFKKLWRSNNTELSKAIGQLATGALFFGMRSCEYSEVTGNRKTKLLQLKNIRFFQGRQEIAKSKNMNLNNITCVTITFMKQKNKHKEADITMHKSNSELCPVMAWGSIVKRILHYNNTNLDTPVNYVELHNKP